MAARKRRSSRNQEADTPHDGRMSPVRLLAIRVLIALALGLSGYLLFLSLSGSRAIGCGPDSGCDQVLSSRWSSWFQIPVSLLAVLADVVFLAGTFLLGRNLPMARQRQGWAIVVPCAVLLTGAALWFVFLQLVIVRSICPYCMAAHTAGLLAALIALVSAPIITPQEKSWKLEKTVFIPQAAFRRLSGLALLGVAGLILGQIVYAPKTYVEISQNIAGTPPSTSSLSQPASPARTGSVTSGTTSQPAGSARSSQVGEAANPGTDVPIQNTTPGTTAPLTTAAP
ncbi:MAG TPA: vitamin K epoxide reductase family protein, partial [Verrucomicrobiae bacterium]|nr:vitamin K epoxide reductase family protein [Verrucomicrobiae bacterium]